MPTAATTPCFFCELIVGRVPARIVWHDRDYIAFLTPFPNTTGFTVVAPKKHLPSYVLSLDPEPYMGLMLAARTVGRLLDHALGTRRTGLIAEGMGIDHAHVKLAPMHGIPEGEWKAIRSTVRTFYDRYQGFIASHDGPAMDEAELDLIADRIRKAEFDA